MKELILKRSNEIKSDKFKGKLYLSYLTFREYLNLIQNKTISLPEVAEGYHNLVGVTQSKSKLYNNNEYMSEIIGFEINLFVDKEKGIVNLEDNNLSIQAEVVNVLDGIVTTHIISKLDERLMDSFLLVRVYIGNMEEARMIVMALNSYR